MNGKTLRLKVDAFSDVLQDVEDFLEEKEQLIRKTKILLKTSPINVMLYFTRFHWKNSSTGGRARQNPDRGVRSVVAMHIIGAKGKAGIDATRYRIVSLALRWSHKRSKQNET